MTEAHWLTFCCPFFSVFDLEKYVQVFGPRQKVSVESLNHVGLRRAARWLTENAGRWAVELPRFERIGNLEGKSNVQVFWWGHERYPKNLKHLHFPPPFIFVTGDSECLHAPLLSVVGARHPTGLGRLWTQKVMPLVARRGVCLVSGGARGIDAEAHQAALDGGSSTIAFLPGSVDEPYPRGNRYLFDRIKEAGVLVSEFPPGTVVRAENFHRRNRLIAGISEFVLVIEAGEASGTIMTANRALAENREVMVVPGPPFVASYSGSLALLADGAIMVRDEKDIIAQLIRKNVLKL